MKKTFLVTILFSFIGFSQTNNSTQLPSLNSISINNTFIIQPILFNTSKKTFSTSRFTSFNSHIGLAFNYVKTNETYSLSNFNSNVDLFRRNKIDSFNPNGVHNIGAALIMGTLNLILNN